MVKVRFRVQNIESLQPAVDSRNSDKVFVLEGRNYYFDSKGPKSGFGTRLVADNSLIENEGGVVQSITAGKATYVFTSKGCYVMADNQQSWIQILDLEARWPDVPLKDDKKWTFVYLTKGIYFCHPVYGFYKVVKTPDDYYLDPRDQNDIPGLPFQPQAIAESNGRMIVLGFKYAAWSGPSNAEDFLPALGGAGQELLSDRIAGDPVTCVGFQTGFIVWTTQGCLSMEFIGGDTVFRFNRVTTEQLPVNAYAVEAMPDGSQVLCTRHGLFQIQNAQEPVLITPLFSEFIRERLEHEQGIRVRLTYALEQNLLFFQMRDWTNHYVHTYVLSMALDKWGSFDERHLGIIKLIPARGNWGYVDSDGRPHRFIEVFNREDTPHHFIGLDSNITIGYIKPPELHGEIDSLLEMHEITLGGHPAIPSWYDVDLVDLGTLPSIFLSENLVLHGFPVDFALAAACETTEQEPTVLLAPSQAPNQLEDNYSSTNDIPGDDKWWDDISNPAIDYDTGNVYQYVNKSYLYDDPNYITDKTFLNQINPFEAGTVAFNPGPFTGAAAGSTTHYLVHDDVIFFDRHQPAVWAIHDWYNTAGSTLTRAKEADNFVFQAAMFYTTSHEDVDPDTGLGEVNLIMGFTEDNVIILHEVRPSHDFKLETLNKDTLTRVSQAYIQPGVGNINGAIEAGDYFGNQNFCLGPDEKVYHATFKDSGAFGNGTRALLMRYDPVTGDYDDITPWSSGDLPISGPGVTATNWGVKAIFYDRVVDKIAVIFGYRLGPFFNKNSRYVWSISHWDIDSETWTNLGALPDTDYLDADFVSCDQGDASWCSTGMMILDTAKNVDGLPMGSPCQELLHTVEYVFAAPGGVQDFVDSSDHATSGYHICVRDPAAGYAVTQRFRDIGTRYDALRTEISGPQQFLQTLVGMDAEKFGITSVLPRVWYMPNHRYMAPENNLDAFYQTEYGEDWNEDNSIFYLYLEP